MARIPRAKDDSDIATHAMIRKSVPASSIVDVQPESLTLMMCDLT
jgi:hypothetical protein